MEVYVLECRTGCSCCSDNNHYRGLYGSREMAEARKKRFLSGKDYPVASRYARHGNYSIFGYEAEEISNMRIIIDNKVFSNILVDVNLEEGTLNNCEDDTLSWSW